MSNGASIPSKVTFATTMEDTEPESSAMVTTPNGSTHLIHFRSNLMREQHDRDPLFYYEIVSVLGVGSMGSVAKVKKRDETIGGTARKEMVADLQRERVRKECWKLPLIGDCLRNCYEKAEAKRTKPDALHRRGSSLLGLRTDALEDVHRPLLRGMSNYEVLYAMKSIHLNRVTDPEFVEELKNEIEILRQLDHPHIVRAIETFENRNQIFIVMELCSGGDLYTRDPYTEEEAARIVHAILSAISYMHSMKIAHRDLKYENILFVSKEPSASVKLIDFGLSKAYGSNQCDLTEGVGTIYSMAPEVLTGKYTQQADMWSVGVVAFMLLSSQMPFYGRKRQHIVELILKGQYEFRGRRWKRVSPQARQFVQELLVVDPKERATSHDAMGSTWLHRRLNSALTLRDALADEEEKIQQSIVRYSGYSRLKKMALNVVVRTLV
jgi:serine/threonine protein kinase